MNPPLETPVLLLIFNRPDVTRKVFEQIRNARPKQLFIAADGPRTNMDDSLKCIAARDAVSVIDWDCDVKTLFSEKNWGCGKGPAMGISWFFNHVSEGIILEDDCLPAPSFFTFCQQLLRQFRNDTRIMEIGGANLMESFTRHDSHSYFFSEHNHTWGWATWKRAWQHYDFEIKSFQQPDIRKFLKYSFNSQMEYDHFNSIFLQTFYSNDSISWWDYQWEFARRINTGLSIVPRTNLVVNIGLGPEATHTLDPKGLGSKMKAGEMSFPLSHPEFIMVNHSRDNDYFRSVFTSWRSRVKYHVKKLMPFTRGDHTGVNNKTVKVNIS